MIRILIGIFIMTVWVAVAAAGSFFDLTSRSTALIPNPDLSANYTLGTKGTYTLPTGAEVSRVDWSCDKNDSPTFTAVAVKVQMQTFNRYSAGVRLYTTNATFRHTATGAMGVHPLTSNLVFSKISSANAATCRFLVQ